MGTRGEVRKNAVRSTAGVVGKSALIKSGLCKSQRWGFGDATFALKVPAVAEAKGLRDWLWSKAEPMAQYMAQGGEIVAWQWRLRCDDYRSIWMGKDGVKLD